MHDMYLDASNFLVNILNNNTCIFNFRYLYIFLFFFFKFLFIFKKEKRKYNFKQYLFFIIYNINF